jgi:MFS family permease
VQFLAPFYLERVLGQSPATTGLVVLALPAAMALCGLVAGVIVDRVGSRRVAVAGALVLIVGLALTVQLGPDWGPLDLAWRLAIVGTGLGLFNGPNQTAIPTAAQAGEQATASAASGLARSLAFAGGPLLATSAWAMWGYQPAGMRVGVGLGLALCAFAVVLVAGVVRGERGDPSAAAATTAVLSTPVTTADDSSPRVRRHHCGGACTHPRRESAKAK